QRVAARGNERVGLERHCSYCGRSVLSFSQQYLRGPVLDEHGRANCGRVHSRGFKLYWRPRHRIACEGLMTLCQEAPRAALRLTFAGRAAVLCTSRSSSTGWSTLPCEVMIDERVYSLFCGAHVSVRCE